MTGLRVTCLAPGELDDLAGALAAAKLPTADLAEPGRAGFANHLDDLFRSRAAHDRIVD